MSKETAKQRRARIKTAKIKREARLTDVEGALVLGARSGEIERTLSTKHGVSTRMIRKDMQLVRERWADMSLDDNKREYKVFALERRIDAFYQKCLSAKALGAAARALSLQADILGAKRMNVKHEGTIEHKSAKDSLSDILDGIASRQGTSEMVGEPH